MRYLKLLFIPVLTIFLSCSHSKDENQTCLPTKITMVVNGVPQTWNAGGRGIDLTPIGYKLSINLDRSIAEPYSQQGVSIILPYKVTGANVIKSFHYLQYDHDQSFEGDFVDGQFKSYVISNTQNCLLATFSGKLNDGDQEIVITNGSVSYLYETPFEN